MKRILIAFIIYHSSLIIAFAQNLDSLYSVWQDQTQPDSARAKAYANYIWEGFADSKPDTAFVLAEELVGFGQEKQYPNAQAFGYRIQGWVYKSKSNYPKALEYYQLNLIIREEIGNKTGIATALDEIGVIYYYQSNYPKALEYFQRSLKISEEIGGDNKKIAGLLNNIGLIYNYQSNYAKALEYYQRNLKINEEIGDKMGISTALSNFGLTHMNQNNYPKALAYYQRSLKIYEEIEDKKGTALVLNSIGNIYGYQSNNPKALEYFQRSLKIAEEIGDKRGMANALGNIGLIYSRQSNNLKALEYYQRSLKISEEFGDRRGIATSLGNIGRTYSDQSNYPKALAYYQRSLKIREEIGDKNGMALVLNSIGLIYKSQSNNPEALEYFQRSLKIAEDIGDKRVLAASLINIGGIYNSRNDHQAALIQCKKSFEICEEIEVLDLQKDACSCLYDTYKAMGNGNEALVYLEKMSVLNDSLHAEETAKKLQQMEFAKQVYQDSVETFEKERQVELAHQEEMRAEERTRNIAIGGGGLVLLLAGGIYSRLRYVRKSKAALQTEKDRSDNLLLNILPEEIAQELKEKGKADARDFDQVSILFTDFVSFTETAEKLSAAELVEEINHCFEAFDHILEKYKIEKIKTIGDAYMAAGGLPVRGEDSVKNTVLAALEMQEFIEARGQKLRAKGQPHFQMRVGIHTGPVVAGIVGVKKFQYDIWGDTVNTASRVESAGEVGKVNISQATYKLLAGPSTSSGSDEGSESRALSEVEGQLSTTSLFDFESRGKIEVKGKGEISMYFVTRNSL